jgi:methylenetetrahydrofolate reductase (NADPH)
MKVIEHINTAKDTLISFEVLPPLKGKGIGALYGHLDPLMEFKPSFINVTYHRSEHVFKKKADGSFEKIVVRKRPGTESICAAIMNKYNVDTVPHLICGGFGITLVLIMCWCFVAMLLKTKHHLSRNPEDINLQLIY